MVGDRDRAEAAVAGGLEQDLDRRRAVGRVVGVHVQVDLDQLAAATIRRRTAGSPVAVVAPGSEPPRRRSSSWSATSRPAARRRAAAPPAADHSRSCLSVAEARRAAPASVCRVAGREQQPQLAVADAARGRLGSSRDDRHRPRRRAPGGSAPAPARGPPEAAQTTSARGDQLLRRAVAGPTSSIRSRRRRAIRSGVSVGAVGPDRRLPVEVRGQPPQGAQEEPQRAALLFERRRRSAAGPCGRRRGAARPSAPGRISS